MELAEILAEYSSSVSYEDLGEEEIHEAKRRIIDSMGVAKASINSKPAEIIRKLNLEGNFPMLGGSKGSPDYASFYNTFLIRYLDFNDTYLSKEPLHPSDIIGGLLTLGMRGKDIILSIVVGYEVGTRLCDSASLRLKGFDHVNFTQVASAVALSKLLNLSKEQTVNAISMTVVPHVALRQSRVGKLSMWKAGATAEAIRNSVFAVLLAKEGFTGPEKPFSGEKGFRLITDLDYSQFEKMGTRKILQTSIKKYPVEYHAQALVEAILNLKYEGEIKKIIVETYEAGKSILADEEKWRPETKETADHSIPFITATTLLLGKMWLENYSLIGDVKVNELMKKVEVVENPDYTKVYPKELPVKVVVITDKERFESEVRSPRGYYNNRMSDQEVEEKALRLGLSKEVINKLWNFENENEVDKIVGSI
ncbi:MmgE/PrpD family protein [Acidianus sp. HS-5]|uniref:MmgE/PrpD family protein n=1 Tax=Acidianus sp. HS-5 TaxID=2886040 RepID=UPI001F2C5653|nr:MmgE/PrpD family protein [Acidianus sp. HS-5]BDC17626.1 2-methylcitrate dehydratase [Acidianus sp. HS-5]